jgi:opacity protein-like surface antigen
MRKLALALAAAVSLGVASIPTGVLAFGGHGGGGGGGGHGGFSGGRRSLRGGFGPGIASRGNIGGDTFVGRGVPGNTFVGRNFNRTGLVTATTGMTTPTSAWAWTDYGYATSAPTFTKPVDVSPKAATSQLRHRSQLAVG